MTPNDLFAQIAQFTSTGIITLSPGPFKIRIGEADIYAAQLLGKLYDDFADSPVKDLNTHLLNSIFVRVYDLMPSDKVDLWEDEQIQMLLMAWWWMLFFTAQNMKKDNHD